MNPDAFKHRRVALLYVGDHNALPQEYSAWEIANLDQFYENLDMWAEADAEPLDCLFSASQSGIQKHVANFHGTAVGVAGMLLADHLEEITQRYLQHGYDVAISNGDDFQFIEAPEDNRVRIVWD